VARKVTKQSKRRLAFFGTASCLIIVCFIYTLISYIYQINNLEKQEIYLQNKLVELKNSNTDLKNEIEKLKDPEYLARYARENFLYSKDGEYIIKIDENDNLVLEMNTKKIDTSKKILTILSILIFIIIIYIFVKIRIEKKSKNKKKPLHQ